MPRKRFFKEIVKSTIRKKILIKFFNVLLEVIEIRIFLIVWTLIIKCQGMKSSKFRSKEFENVAKDIKQVCHHGINNSSLIGVPNCSYF